MQRYADLKVWQRAHQLVLRVYELSTSFPADERFGLISQVRRASFSLAANLAQGSQRATAGDFARHLSIAQGSVGEVDYCLLAIFATPPRTRSRRCAPSSTRSAPCFTPFGARSSRSVDERHQLPAAVCRLTTARLRQTAGPPFGCGRAAL